VSSADSRREIAQEDFLYHLYRGSEMLQDNRVLEAKEELEQALTMQPLDAKGQDLLGAVYFRLGLYPRAIQIYEALEGQFPADVSIKINLALCYLKTGQPEPARRVLREIVQINPEHKRAWGYLGLALQKLGEFEQAQIAFEKGGRPTMARRVTEFRRSLIPPAPDSSPPEIAQGVRDMAQAAFSELDAGELRFALAEPAAQPAGDATWHTLELGGTSKRKEAPRSPFSKTLPPPWMAGLERGFEGGLESVREAGEPASFSFMPLAPALPGLSVPPVPRLSSLPPRLDEGERPRVPPVVTVRERHPLPAPLLMEPREAGPVSRLASGAVLVQTGLDATAAFASRLDALRVVAGSVTTRVLHRRSRDTETNEVLGGLGNPIVRVAGDAQLVLGSRPGHRLVVLEVHDDLAFVREEPLAGFELRLQYETGRVALEAGERGAAEGVPVVQLRGSGSFVLEVAGELTSLPSRSGQPLLARREWVVGWFGRLVTRALSSAEAPGGHRGMIGFSGDGTVLVCVA
jgi:Tetratricopeptide repeat